MVGYTPPHCKWSNAAPHLQRVRHCMLLKAFCGGGGQKDTLPPKSVASFDFYSHCCCNPHYSQNCSHYSYTCYGCVTVHEAEISIHVVESTDNNKYASLLVVCNCKALAIR